MNKRFKIRAAIRSAQVAFIAACCVVSVSAASSDAELFELKVQPILREHCFKCHSHGAEKIKGGLVMDSASALLTGGDTGPAIVPGHPEKSLLIDAIKHTGELKMPAKANKLSDDDIAVLEQWVKAGAPAPATKAVAGSVSATLPNGPAKRTGKITDEDRKWWAYQPLKPVMPPSVKNAKWARNDTDRFVLARLEAEGLAPSAEAPRATLARRLYFDLWGLPPTPADVDAFVSDKSTNAYEKLVDKLLASPHYGERWARYWLDLVRYADSDGYRLDAYRPNAWRYRDYVINALNTDKPYDRFVKEQLAGDELFPGDPEATIATGYLCHWIYEYNNRDAEGQWKNILIDITDTTGDVFLGAGLQCARCHDHKFDPILQKDYFALQAFFAGMIAPEQTVAATKAQREEHAKRSKVWEEKTASLRKQIDAIEGKHMKSAEKSALEKFPEEVQAMMRKPVAERTPYEHQIAELAYRQVTYEYARMDSRYKGEEKEKYLALKKQLAEHDKLKPAPLPVAIAAIDLGPHAAPVTIPKKGNTPIEPGFLTVLGDVKPNIKPLPNSTGRRTALAEWLTQPDNPSTARLVVNRVWQQHFGRGLAANASDFGKLGEKPSHPELLDWLATRFVADGWSLKKLHKLIVTSATYRQSSVAADVRRLTSTSGPGMRSAENNQSLLTSAATKDPENRLLWRANTRRLEAEQIRDSVYALTGELDPKAGGPGANFSEPRRSIYCKFLRNTRDPLIDVFDAPFWFTSASSRDTTTTPVQSLLLINSQFMLQRAKALASRLEKDASMDDAKLVERAYQLAFSRAPKPAETEAAMKFLREQPTRIDAVRAGSAKAAFLYDKMPYRDGQAAIMTLVGEQSRFEVADNPELMPNGDFTIEAYVLLRSVDESAGVRTLAAKWTGKGTEPGWGFGVTGKKSRRKPQTLVLQLHGKRLDGSFGEDALFSDQNIQLNKPYYLAAAVKLAHDGQPGEATFFVKDLSNDDEPLLIAKLPVKTSGGFETREPFTIGGRARNGGNFDGLIDDVRLSNTALGVDALLFTNEGINKHTVGYWQFEAKPDVFRDNTGHGLDIKPGATLAKTKVDTRKAALQDLCHVLLNSNEFLYVE